MFRHDNSIQPVKISDLDWLNCFSIVGITIDGQAEGEPNVGTEKLNGRNARHPNGKSVWNTVLSKAIVTRDEVSGL